MRLDKFICKSTDHTLAQAQVFIEEKQLRVNGYVITDLSHQVHKNNTVLLNDKILIPRSSRYFLLNKPLDMICSNVDEKHPSVLRLFDIDKVNELHIAGRLDANTTGLVLVTDDGHWSFNLTSPKNSCEKLYEVQLSRPINVDVIARFKEGVFLQRDPKRTLPAKLEIINPYNVLLTITEGRYHQVKRMFASIGNRVKALHRRKVGGLEVDVRYR